MKPRLVFMACLLLLVGASRAQEPEKEIEDFEELDLEELLDVVFTAAKHKQDIAESPSAVTVITREDIESSGARTLPEALRMVPNMDIGLINPLWYEVGVRGASGMAADTMLLLVDGRDVTMELFGFPSWVAQHFSMDDVERIEVIRGPGSALYGANAFSGVVHVITRAPGSGPRAMASVRGGEHGLGEITCRARETFGPLAVSAGAGLVREDFWTGRGDLAADLARGWVDAKIELGPTSDLELDGGFLQTAGRFYSYSGVVDVDDMVDLFSRVRFRHGDLDVQAFYDHFDFSGDFNMVLYYKELGVELARLPPFEGSVDKIGVQVQHALEVPLRGNRITYGAEYYYQRYYSKVLVEPEHQDHRIGLYLQDEIDLQAILDELWSLQPPPLILTGGLRFDESYLTRREFSPRASLVCKAVENHSFRLGYAHAFLKPTFFESSLNLRLDSDVGFEELDVSNPDLNNRTIDTIEAGYNGRFLDGKLLLRLDVAYSWYRNNIQFKFDLDEMDYKQFGDLRIPDISSKKGIGHYNAKYGKSGHNVEIQVIAKPTKYSRVFLHTGYRQLFKESTGAFDQGEPVWRLSAGADLKGTQGWTASVRAFYSDSFYRRMFSPEGMLEPRMRILVPATLLLNARVAWTVSTKPFGLTIGLECFNLLGNRFRESPGKTVPNDVDFGAERLSRRVVLFLTGEI